MGARKMDSNVCLGCRFGSVKIEVLVPEQCDIREFADETRNFTSEIVAITKAKRMHYCITFGSGSNYSKLDFKVHCSCILNIKKKECSNFNSINESECKVRHLIYSKESASEPLEIKISQ